MDGTSKAWLFPEACLVGARLVYFECWTEPVPQNLGQLCRWALLNHLIAERSCYGHAAAAGSKLWQLSFTPPFPSTISPQSCTGDRWKTLIFEVYTDTKHAWYKSFSFHVATKPFHAKQQTVRGTLKKVWNVQQHCDVHRPFSGKQDAYITSMYPL